MRNGFRLLALPCLMVLCLNSSCGPILLLGGAAAGATVASSDRTVGEQIDDLVLWRKIRGKLSVEGHGSFSAVSVQVNSGNAVLSGEVSRVRDKMVASNIARSVSGVRSVIDDIAVNSGGDVSVFSDAGITAAVKVVIVEAVGISRSVNYSVSTTSGVVTVVGTARSSKERDSVVRSVKNVHNVEGVKYNIAVLR